MIKHITASDNWNKYHKQRKRIVNIYNEASNVHFEQPGLEADTLSNLNFLHCFYFASGEGGVLVEQLMGNSKFGMITFAGLDVNARGCGKGRQLINEAVRLSRANGFEIVGVQMNTADNKAFWQAIGFIEQVPFMDGYALLREGY